MQNKQSSTTTDDFCGGNGKKIYASLLTLAVIFILLFIFIFFILPFILGNNFYISLFMAIGGSAVIAILIALYFTALMAIYCNRYVFKNFYLLKFFIRFSFPVMEFFGKFFGIDKDRLKSIYIELNNSLVLGKISGIDSSQILVLLPHCLQSSQCARRLTYNINNCAQCGRCAVGDILFLAAKYDFQIAIASGGTIARRIVRDRKPLCIIAIACERDLCSGIQDCYPLPVFGLLNERPNGPCRDTTISIFRLEHVLNLLKKNQRGKPNYNGLAP